MARRWAALGKWMLLMSIVLGAAFFGPQPPQQSPKQGLSLPDSSQLYSLFSAGVVAVSSISTLMEISAYKDAVTVQVAAIDKEIEVIEKATDNFIEATDKKIEVIEKATDKKIEAIDKKTEAIATDTKATLVLVVFAVVAGVVVGQRAKD
eukprot:symbB.v1.2.041705.t1/scaffold8528.1/size6026/1